MFHVSIFSNRGSIEEKGLMPGYGPSPWPEDDFPKGVYLFDNIESARKYGFGNGDPFDIWEVSIEKEGLKMDPVTKGAFYTEKAIPPSDIRIKESHLKDVTNPLKERIIYDFEKFSLEKYK